jgi:hypothetical protein
MHIGMDLAWPTLLELITATCSVLIVCLGAIAYLRHVRLERPALGRFNTRDIAVLSGFLVTLPFLYVAIPQWVLTVFLTITFVASMSIGYRPVLGRARLWLAIGILLALNYYLARTMLGTVVGWQLFWTENSVIVALGAIAVANLYVQGGMRLQHVCYFAMLLAAYDAVFTLVWPVTNELTERFLGFPLDPSMGTRVGIYNASIGIGDLLVYALFVTAAAKAYGHRALRAALTIAVVFGAAAPSLAPLLFRQLIDARTDLVVPAQTLFGPAAFSYYYWARRRYGNERTTGQFLRDLRGDPVAANRDAEPARSENALHPSTAAARRYAREATP